MNKRLKGILAFIFLGGIMLTSGIVIGIPGILPASQTTITNTPLDRFSDAERPRLCGTPGAGSTPYIKEYEIDRPCTQPLAITTDADGAVWFTQTNTGNLGVFDPVAESFTEYYNPSWPQTHSMMWGIASYEDGSIWFTEDSQDSIWKYETETGSYFAVDYRAGNSTFPHRIVPLETLLIINDYTGDRLSIFGPTPSSNTLGYWNLYSPLLNAITSEVAVDADYDIWYANWRENDRALLVNFDTLGYYDTLATAATSNSTDAEPEARDYVTTYELPDPSITVNGVAVDLFNRIWLSDTSSSDFYRYDTGTGEFTKYTTPLPQQSAYGNATGVITTPVSRPYFAETDDLGRIIFNEQAANRIAVFDPIAESITEYSIPSNNPNWSDCDEEDAACGIAQVLGFHIDGTKVWFTEWVENNIGVLDTAIPVPYTISLEPSSITGTNSTQTITMDISIDESAGDNPRFIMSSVADIEGIDVTIPDMPLPANGTASIPIEIGTAGAEDGTYKIALGITDDDVAVSQYLSITIGEPITAGVPIDISGLDFGDFEIADGNESVPIQVEVEGTEPEGIEIDVDTSGIEGIEESP